MDPAIVTGLSAVLGSLVGGSATIATAWITQKGMRERELASAEIRTRELLYAEFAAEAARLAIDTYAHQLESPSTLFPLYALLGRIRLLSSPGVIAAADEAVRRITEQYFAPDLSLAELRELARSASHDPQRAFTQACRDELKAWRDDV